MSGAMMLLVGNVSAGDPPSALAAESDNLTPSGSYECTGYPPSVCPSPVTIETDRVNITVTGGTGAGPTFLWEWVSGAVFDIENPTGQNTIFSRSSGRLHNHAGVYKCTITKGVDTVVLNHNVSTDYNYETGM